MPPEMDRLIDILTDAARDELLPRLGRAGAREKADRSLVTEADTALQQRLAAELKGAFPDIPVLGEEMPEAEQESLMAAAPRGLWLLDPLDGTSNFAAGLPFFSLSLALVREGKVMLGLVYDPLRDECFTAVRGEGARLNGQPLTLEGDARPLDRCIALVDFKRLGLPLRQRLASEMPFASQRNLGSSALDWCYLAAGRAHLYLHGRQKPWDYAAGSLILSEAGGFSATLEGEPVYRAAMAGRSVVAATGMALFDSWCAWLGVPRFKT